MQPLIQHLAADGYEIDVILPDGQIHRFKRTPQDNKKTAWYVCRQAHSRAGELFYTLVYGDWREGDYRKFNTLQKATKDDLAFITAQFLESQKKYAEEQKRVWEEAAKEAEQEFLASTKTGASPYLNNKLVKPYGIRFSDPDILVPCRDKEGKFWSFQRITPDAKYFYPCGKTKGTFHTIGSTKDADTILLCEGYATGASLHEATGLPVLVAFYASNLPEVARQFENIIVCADDDQFKTENAGRIWAAKCGATKIIYPKFVSLDQEPTDFNDLHQREGLAAVKKLILEDESERQFVMALGHKDDDYYYTSSSNRQIVRIPRGQHGKATFMDLMPLGYWESVYPGTNGTSWDMAANALMQKARTRGIFDPNNVRGVGVWKDEGRYLINLGDGLYFNDRRHSLESIRSRYIYEIGPRVPEPAAAKVDLELLPNLINCISFRDKIDRLFLLGSLTVAPVAGALDWRPHVWISGASNTGKTTVMRTINNILGLYRHYFQGQTTEAGIRQTTCNGSLPVIFDEFESNDTKSADRVHSVLELMRQASSESEGHVAKGSAGGHAVASRPKFAAIVCSIGVSLPNEADQTRFKVVELIHGSPEAFDNFRHYEAKITPEFAAAYFARTFRMLPTLQKNIDIFWDVLRRKFSARIGQQYGTLLAGAWLAKSDDPVTQAEAEVLCNGLKFEEATRKEELDCVEHLADSFIRMDGGLNRTVRELVKEQAHQTLGRHGLRRDDNYLYISVKNPALTAIFKGTNWADKWGRSLVRLPEAEASGYRIEGKTVRAIKIPISFMLDNKD